MPDHLAILVLAVGGLVAFLIYKGTLSAREAKAERLRGLRALGFEPVDTPAPEIARPIIALQDHGKKHGHRIANVFERRSSTDRLYLLDIEDSSGDSSRDGVIAVFSPRLRIPRLTIYPRLEGEGHLAGLGNRLLKRLAQRHGRTVDLPSHPRFARRHFVSGPDEETLRRFLTADRLDRLAGIEHMAVEGEGDHFTCQRVHFGRRRIGSDVVEIAERVRQAEEVLQALAQR
jgi:hypothetical protein